MSIPVTNDGLVIVEVLPLFDTEHGTCQFTYKWEGSDETKVVYVHCCHMAYLCREEMSKKNGNRAVAKKYVNQHRKLESCCVIV